MSGDRSTPDEDEIVYVKVMLARAGLRATPEQMVGLAKRYRQMQHDLQNLRNWLAEEEEPATVFVAGDPFRDHTDARG